METAIKSTTYIVSSLDNRPKLLRVYQYDSDSVTLNPVDQQYDKPLWFSRKIVFVTDYELLKRLEATYASGDKSCLESLWQEAKIWTPEWSPNFKMYHYLGRSALLLYAKWPDKK